MSNGLARMTEFTESPFVDREEELARLAELFTYTRSGKGQIVFLTGEGGIGKTRLVNELGSRCSKQGAIYATGRSYEGEGVIP